MTRVESTEHAVVFELHPREQQLLQLLFSAYPAVPQTYQSGSAKAGAEHAAECERLLQEALAGQRDANKRQLAAWLAVPERFTKSGEGLRFTLERADAAMELRVEVACG